MEKETCFMKTYRVLLTSDIHSTDVETWYDVRNEDRLQNILYKNRNYLVMQVTDRVKINNQSFSRRTHESFTKTPKRIY